MSKVFTFLIVLFISISCITNKKNNALPNIIVIISDDQGYADVGFHGSKEVFTPNIDRIASNGVIFSEGYASFAVCSPSRAGLITGKYQNRFGYTRNILLTPYDSTMGLPLAEQTIADVLQKADYQTKAIGKWHLGAHKSLIPESRGFDEFYGFIIGGHRYFPDDLNLNDLKEARSQMDGYITKLLDNGKRVDISKYLTEELSDNAVKFIDENSDNPFFLYLSYNAPHTPLQATKKDLERNMHIEKEKRRTYAAMVTSLDDGVGLILDKLEEKNILEASLIAMERAYKSLNINAEMVIVDGINIPKINTNVKAIKNGDNKSISIASASIIAKVIRDKLMEKLSKKYPKFLWEKNSGYGTKKHIENIKILGITPHHRKSFKPILKMIE